LERAFGVVVVTLAIARIGEVLDAADVDAGVTHDALDIRDDLGWWIVGFDSDAGLGRVQWHSGTVERDAVGGPANVAGQRSKVSPVM